jgi:hypothetical protein
MRSELYFIYRWHERNTTRTYRAVVRIRRIMRTLATSGEMRATAGASHPGRKTGTRRRE